MTLPGIRPLTEMDLAAPGPSLLQASRHHVGEVCTWLARVTPATSFLLPIEVVLMVRVAASSMNAESSTLS